MYKFIYIVFLVTCITSCKSLEKNSGYNYKINSQKNFTEKLVVKKSTISDVQESFGFPTLITYEYDKTLYYYINIKTIRKPIRVNQLQSYHITILEFDKSGLLLNTKFDNCENINFQQDYEEEYDSFGETKYGILQQFIKNIARFNK
ncbi:hypothetical protein [Lyticum sinuosum]|uniref:Outer membrane protein assembly factor BamE n=1 Tax=Lyticum sinuosum TaxID=1332059 RepID=A0AAE5AI04_9RICK|nr:hypothetical protein [Lyticum sinuosum]MDZ5761641.1 Outer membrane protein assembly factor BamE [Lyticum sinuosum]